MTNNQYPCYWCGKGGTCTDEDKKKCCDFCKWFYNGESPCNFCKKKQTNFERITASAETLAEFMYCLTEVYHYYVGENMGIIMQYANEDANDKNHVDLIHGNRDFDELNDWLKQESE